MPDKNSVGIKYNEFCWDFESCTFKGMGWVLGTFKSQDMNDKSIYYDWKALILQNVLIKDLGEITSKLRVKIKIHNSHY